MDQAVTTCPRCGHCNDGGPLDGHDQDRCPIDEYGRWVAPSSWVIDAALAREAIEVEIERRTHARRGAPID